MKKPKPGGATEQPDALAARVYTGQAAEDLRDLSREIDALLPLAKAGEKSRAAAPKAGRRSGEIRGNRARRAVGKIAAELIAANIDRREWVDRIAPRLRHQKIPRSDRTIRKILLKLGY
jgi:hypothetical protein